jgi:hypothetical protein
VTGFLFFGSVIADLAVDVSTARSRRPAATPFTNCRAVRSTTHSSSKPLSASFAYGPNRSKNAGRTVGARARDESRALGALTIRAYVQTSLQATLSLNSMVPVPVKFAVT